MKNIITLTVNPALDIYSTVEKLESEKKMKSEPPYKDAGGGGINVSRVLKRLGVEARTIYTRGGYTGKIFEELLNSEGLNQDPIEVKNDLRQNFAVSESSTGNLFRFGFPGAELSEEELDAVLKKIEGINEAEYLVASGSLPPNAPKDFYSRIAKIAKEKDIKFILDTSGVPLKEILKEGAFLIKPNADELEQLTGKKANSEEDQKKFLKEILEEYPIEIIVLSLGPKGAILATRDNITHFPAPKVDFISSIGAGDSMVAGIVCSLSQGNSLEDAVMFGLACGSATIKSPGTELLTKKDAEALFKELKNEVNA